MKKTNKIPTIIGTIILLAGVFAGVFLLKTTQIFKIGASPTASPKNVRVANISGDAATVTWTTDDKTTAFISFGEDQSNLNKIQKETENDDEFFVHEIILTGLKADTLYYYKINSGGTNYDNNGVPWTFTTGKDLGVNPNSIAVSGSIITTSGQPSKRTLVYMNVGGYLMSTLTSDEGNYVFQLGIARNPDLRSYVKVDITKTLLEISAQTGEGDTASAQIFPQSANPVPPLMLGKVEDYRNLQPNQNGQNPSVDLNLPEGSTSESKFNVDTNLPTPKTTSVILESLEQGEVVTSTTPEFFGKGPGGEKITITVHSQTPVTGSVTIPSDGSWNWSPPTDLEPGAHTITISWLDATGITRSLTRNFVVQAGEAPAFVATPSQTLATATPTASATATPRATATPTATPRATSTPTSTATPSATTQAVPVTGSLTPTLLLTIMGLGVLAFSFFVWRYSNN